MIPGSSVCNQNSGSYSYICDYQPADLSSTQLASWHTKIGHPTCTPKGIIMSLPVDLERHGIYQNVWNGNLVKMVPLKSMSDQKQGKSYQNQLSNIISHLTCQNWLPNIIGWLTCAVHQNNHLDECVKWAIEQVPGTTNSQTRHPLSLERSRSKNCMVMFLKELDAFLVNPTISHLYKLDADQYLYTSKKWLSRRSTKCLMQVSWNQLKKQLPQSTALS